MANVLLDQFEDNQDTKDLSRPAKLNTGNILLDQFESGGDGNYTSTTETPEKKAGYIVSTGAGILSGAEKAVEGVLTTGTLLADLGLGTELTKKVEDWFDSQEIFNQLEDVADDTWLGKTTEIMVQLGVPGGFAIKGANALLKAKKLGILNKTPNLARFGAAGVADAIASTKDIPTIGDLLGGGPTEQRKSQGEEGRSEAFRRLTNKFKFGMEGALGFSLFDKVVIPAAKGAFKLTIPTVKGVIRNIKGPGSTIVRKEFDPRYEAYLKVKAERDALKAKGIAGTLDSEGVEALKAANQKVRDYVKQGVHKLDQPRDVTQQLETGWQFSSNNIIRKFQELIGSKLTAASKYAGTDIFKLVRDRINTTRSLEEQVRIDVQALGNAVDDILNPKNKNNIIKILEKKGVNDRTKLMENIHEFLSSGKMGRLVDYKTGPKAGTREYRPYTPTELKQRQSFIDSNIPEELLPYMITIRDQIDALSNRLLNTEGIAGAKGITPEFLETVKANIGEYITRQYKAFDANPTISQEWITKLYNTKEGLKILEKAKRDISKANPKMYGEIVGETVDPITGKKFGGRFVPYNDLNARQMDDEIKRILYSGGEFEKLGENFERLYTLNSGISKARKKVPKSIRDLLGEVRKIDESYINTVRKLNDYTTTTKFYNDVLASGNGKYFFDNPEIAEGGLKFTTRITSDNALNNKYTTPQLARALGELAESNNNRFLNSPIYNTFFLGPKAFTQESLTTLNPFTHVRNVVSALSFTGMNGNWFRDPRKIYDEFGEVLDIVKGESKSKLETEFGKKIFSDEKSLKQMDAYIKQVRELQDFGVINNSPRLQDMAKLIDDVADTRYAENIAPEGIMYKIFKGFDPSGPGMISKIRRTARNAYATEDNFFKVQNYMAEQKKYKEVWDNFYNNDVNGFVTKYKNDAATFGISADELFTRQGYNRYVKQKSADIVKNNIPNYDYVGDFIKSLRRLPLGNFISFPVETIRTGINTLRQGVKELSDPLTTGIGTKRLLGVATFGGLMGSGAVELGQLMYGVSDKTLNALKEYLPNWSKNSHIVPIKQGGELYYIDFSHTNAYDLLTRPARAAINAFNQGVENEESVLQSVQNAGWEALGELAQPFLSESIITEWMLDVSARGGKKKSGKNIWNPSDSWNQKMIKGGVDLFSRAAPLGYKQMERIYLSGVGNIDQYNRGYKFMNEVSGTFGFRIQDPFIEQGLGFKINANKRAERNEKDRVNDAIFDGNSTLEDITSAYDRANEEKFKADQALFKQIEAAKQLGLSNDKIRKDLLARYSKSQAFSLMRGEYTPLNLSSFAKQTVKKNHLLRNLPDPTNALNFLSRGIVDKWRGNIFFEDVEGLFERPLDFMEDRTPNIVIPQEEKFNKIPQNTAPIVPAPNQGNILLDQFSSSQTTIPTTTGNVISPSDTSQLAKSGDIDITEAIAARRT
jgi:hypothetical protein